MANRIELFTIDSHKNCNCQNLSNTGAGGAGGAVGSVLFRLRGNCRSCATDACCTRVESTRHGKSNAAIHDQFGQELQ
jgi:hypothetical protein